MSTIDTPHLKKLAAGVFLGGGLGLAVLGLGAGMANAEPAPSPPPPGPTNVVHPMCNDTKDPNCQKVYVGLNPQPLDPQPLPPG